MSSSIFSFIKKLYTKKSNQKYPKVNVTWSGASYVYPEDILKSENAQKQIRELKKTGIVKKLKTPHRKQN